MAGNAVSIIGITTNGRGGFQTETLPRSSNRSFTISNRNTGFRCSNCNTSLPNITYSDIQKKGNVCPFCHEKDVIETMTGRPIRADVSGNGSVFSKKIKKQEVFERRLQVFKLHKEGLTQKIIAEKLGVCLATIVNDCVWLKANNYDIHLTRGRKSSTIDFSKDEVVEVPINNDVDKPQLNSILNLAQKMEMNNLKRSFRSNAV